MKRTFIDGKIKNNDICYVSFLSMAELRSTR